MRNILGVKKPIDALVAGNERAKKNCENDGNTGKVLYPPIAKSEPLVGSLARKQERNAQRNSCRGISEIMNGVRQQAHAA